MKDEVMAVALEYHATFYSNLAKIAELKSNFKRLESELYITRSVN